MIGLPAGTKIWLAAGVTDMRAGMNGLAVRVQAALAEDPFSGHVFVFRGQRGDMLKVLRGSVTMYKFFCSAIRYALLPLSARSSRPRLYCHKYNHRISAPNTYLDGSKRKRNYSSSAFMIKRDWTARVPLKVASCGQSRQRDNV